VGAPGVGCNNQERCNVDGAVYLFQEVGGSKWMQVAHVATVGAGDNVQLRTSGGTMLSDYVFDVKAPEVGKGKEPAQSPGSSAGGSSGGGGSISFEFLLLISLLLCAGYRGRRPI